MSAWSHGNFDSDDAMDWVGKLEATRDTTPISEAFEAAMESVAEFLEVSVAAIGLAAAEVAATLLSNSPAKLPDEVLAWLAGKKVPKAAMVDKAQRVVARILRNSELRELWAESEDSALWSQEVESLLRRLGGTPT